jgi:FKBP-type peptidyl-prolyl cis-trans isomerase
MKLKSTNWMLGMPVFMALVLMFSFTSCSKYKGFKKDKSGYYYKIYEINDTAPQLKRGDVAVLTYSIRIIDSTLGTIQNYIRLDSSFYSGDLMEALTRLHRGDSATFIFEAAPMIEHYFMSQFPFDSVKEIFIDVKINDLITKEYIDSMNNVRLSAEQEAQEAEPQKIADYIAANNISEQPTESGMYLIVSKKGKGANPKEGQIVSVHYTGKFFDGTVFDSSVERGTPFEFPLGTPGIIQGWNEGFALLNKGSKATLILPSAVAYGSTGNRGIPPYTPLVFDVELIDIKDAPATPQQ